MKNQAEITAKNIPAVQNMVSSSGNKVANQFVISTNEGTFFQSYKSVIAFIPYEGKTLLDFRFWDYSTTTGKYRNIFLKEKKQETQKAIEDGRYILADLNK